MQANRSDVAHVLRRVGFFAEPEQVEALQGLTRADLVELVLDTTRATGDAPPPELLDPACDEWWRWKALTCWWLDRMLDPAGAVVEKMTLFWHGHFVSSNDKVPISWLYDQNRLFRREALGDFRTLVQQMAVQPAMLRYLDNETNLASAPNLNFGRELLELFLLGAGNYGEDDVVTAARAWTGHGLDALGTYRYAAHEHDHGLKTFLGEERAWDGPELIDALLDRSNTRALVCRLVAEKLCRFLVSPTVSAQLVADAATAFGASGLQIGALMRAILNHPEFWEPAARHSLVRPPVDYVVALLRSLRLGPEAMPPDWYLPQLGQVLFRPPDVSGWGGTGRWQAPGVARAKLDFSAHAAWMATGGGADRGVLADVALLEPEDVLRSLARAFGIAELSMSSRDTVLGWLDEQRAAPGDSWAERGNLLVLTSLLPEVQYA